MIYYGLIIGIVLLIIVTATAWLLAFLASHNVAQFREEHHHSLLERKRP